jgi:hypothetical protein
VDFRGHAFLLESIERFRANEELPKGAHIQKAMFLLKTMCIGQFPFSFILYKHGPFSPDIEYELGEMKSYGAVSYDVRPGFSQVLEPGMNAKALKRKVQLSAEEQGALEAVCRFLARKPLFEIELLATVAWIRENEHIRSVEEIASRLQALKPYVSRPEALRSVGEIEQVIHGR